MKTKKGYQRSGCSTIIEQGQNVFFPVQSTVTVPRLSIGDYTRINGPVIVRGKQECSVGKYCAIGVGVTVLTTNHDIRRAGLQINMYRRFGFRDLEVSEKPVVIGHSVWIGDNVTILSGVSVGHGSVIGAGAVVTKDVPPCSVYAGVPARKLSDRYPQDVIDLYLELAWWDWTEERIARNQAFFDADLSAATSGEVENMVVE